MGRKKLSILQYREVINPITDKIKLNLSTYFPEIKATNHITLKVNSLKVDYFSFLLDLDILSPCLCLNKGVYVKITRRDWNQYCIKDEIKNPESIRSALEEYKNLKKIYEFTLTLPPPYSSIRPLDYYKDYNAIITEKVYGWDLFVLCRHENLFGIKRKSGSFLKMCGQWIRYFHEGFCLPKNAVLNYSHLRDEILTYINFIKDRCCYPFKFEQIQQKVEGVIENKEIVRVPYSASIEGFEIRNILVDHQKIYVLDPGTIEYKPIYQDLAHFIVSLIILYWGSPWFFLFFKPKKYFIDSFLEGYFEDTHYDRKSLTLFIVKELLHSWYEAHIVADYKAYHKLAKFVFRKFYIDRFYIKEINRQLRMLEKI